MAVDEKISAGAGETGGPAETSDLTTTYLRKDGLYANPFTTLPAVVPVTPASTVAVYGGVGGSSTGAGGGILDVVGSSGLTMLAGGVIPGSVVTSAVTVANTSAISQLVGGTIPANDAVAGSTYFIRAAGFFSNTSTPNLTFTLAWGGTGGVSIAATPATATGSGVSNALFEVEATMTVWTTTTAVGVIRAFIGTSGSTDAGLYYVNTPTSAATIAVTSQKVLSLAVTWGTASSSNTLSAIVGYAAKLA